MTEKQVVARRKKFVQALYLASTEDFTLREWSDFLDIIAMKKAAAFEKETGRPLGSDLNDGNRMVHLIIKRADPPSLKEIPEWQEMREKDGL